MSSADAKSSGREPAAKGGSMLGLLAKLPGWLWVLAVLVAGVLIEDGTRTSNGAVALVAYALTVGIVQLVAALAPFIAVVFGVLALLYAAHDHGKAIALGISAVVFGASAIGWHVGLGAWVFAHWLVRPA